MEKITFSWKRERLDIFLVTHYNYSRNFFHHIIKRWWVLVNGNKAKKSYKLKDGDSIEIDDLQRFLSSDILKDLPFIDLEVKLEKEDYMVIYKPKWVLAHPNSVWDLRNPSVVWFLYHKFREFPSIWNFIRAGIIHRLDKDTDGFMIIVKTEKWLTYFKKLFQKKSLAEKIEDKEKVPLKKFYRAKVNITEIGKKFLDSIEEFPYYIEEMVEAKIPYGEPKLWITKIFSVKKGIQFDNGIEQQWIKDLVWEKQIKLEIEIAELELEILTGKTHQIRYHLAEHWLPIIGDKLYGFKEDIDMQLTAFKLEFEDTEGQNISLS